MEKTPRGIVIADVWAEKGRREGRRWRARVRDPIARKYLSGSFDERSEALAWAKGKLPRLRVGVETAQSTSLETVGAEYVQELQDRQRNPGHIAEVQRVIASAVASGARLISDKGFHGQVRNWWRNLKARATHTDKTGKEVVRRKNVFELAASTRNRYLIHLKAVTAYALRRRLILHDPLLGMAGVEPEDFIKPTFTVAELRSIIVNQPAPDNPVWLWFTVMVYAGCRASEALHLRWEWIDWEGRGLTIRIHSDYNLKRKKERSIPLQQELSDILDPLRKDEGWMFEEERFREANTKSLWQRFGKLLRDAGLANGDRSPHSCRHTFACLMLASREDVFTICRAMGHKDLTMTDHYSRESAGPRNIAEAEGWKPGEIRLKLQPPENKHSK